MPEITTPQTTETAPAPAQTTPRPPVKPNGGRKKKKMVKNLIILAVVLALLAAGGFALYRFLFSTGGEEGEIFSQPAFLGSIQSKVSGIVTLAASAAFATQTPVEFDLKGHDEFVKSLGKDAIAPQQRTAEESKAILAKVYNEKLEQHVSSFHYEKGVTCISCHDQQKQGGPDWMVPVTNPPMKKECGDCHETQAYVVSHTKSHSKYECTVCHMPNTAAGPNDGSNGKMDAVRRLHTYKINVSPDASTWTKDKDGAWVLSKDEDGHGYVDLMWSCARNAPADYTVAEGRGCHSKATSELDPGLVYQDEKEVYGEVMKWQKPVKDGYEQIKGGVERVSKLLEVTALPYEKQTQIRLLLDKATEVSDLIEKDGSWGAHASHYLQDRVKSALSYIDQAQTLLDKGGY